MEPINLKEGGSFNFEEALNTGNLSFDMMMACIALYRAKDRVIDTIWMNEKHFKNIVDHINSFEQMKADPVPYDFPGLEFDGVKLKKQIMESLDSMFPTFF